MNSHLRTNLIPINFAIAGPILFGIFLIYPHPFLFAETGKLSSGVTVTNTSSAMIPETDKGVIYSPAGKRDPFREPKLNQIDREIATTNPLEKFSIDQYILRAIVRDSAKAHAMVEDPESKSHLVLEGDVFGRERGTVSRILNTAIIITQKTYNYRGVPSLFEKILYLPQKDEEDLQVVSNPDSVKRKAASTDAPPRDAASASNSIAGSATAPGSLTVPAAANNGTPPASNGTPPAGVENSSATSVFEPATSESGNPENPPPNPVSVPVIRPAGGLAPAFGTPPSN